VIGKHATLGLTEDIFMIPLKVHNSIDYLTGALLLVAPWLFDFSHVIEARTLFLIGGIALIAYSLLTNYDFSLTRMIPLGVHMTLDTVLGIFLILAPALLGYREQVTEAQYVVHVVLGVSLVGLVALTRPRTEVSKTPIDRAAIRHDLPMTR
jgi:hypothetical protein